MTQVKTPIYFLLVCLVVSLAVVYFIVKPFLGPLIVAAVFAFLFQVPYEKIKKALKGWQGISAFLTTIIAIIILVLPIAFIGTQIFREASDLYVTVTSSGGGNDLLGVTEKFIDEARAFVPIPADFEININQYVRQGLNILLNNLGTIFSSIATIFLNLFVFLIAFYFLLKDGHKLKDYFVRLSPLDDSHDDLVISRIKTSVSSVVKGNLSIGLIQGALTGLGFALFGVPNAVLWGSVAAVTALIPGVGTALVLAPAIIFSFIVGNTFGGIGLLIWGIVAVGLIDNLLGPRLVGQGMKLHPLAVFLTVLGGLAFFGPLGFMLGPITLSICLALIEIYFSLKTREEMVVK